MRTSRVLLLLLIISLFSASFCFSQTPLAPITWSAHAIKDPMQSAGFIEVADTDNDGKKEVFLSTLMEQGSAANQATTKGAIRKFSWGSSITGSWTEQMVLSTDSSLPFINHPQLFDVDEDGVLDIVVQQGFLNTNGGSHQWMKGPNYNVMYAFSPDTEKGNTSYFWHESEQYDLDGDGKKDIITTSGSTATSPTQKKIEWYRHMGNGVFQHYIICDTLGGVFIKLHDIDQDGDKDIVVSHFFGPPASAALVWLEQTAAPSAANNWTGDWTYHEIDRTTGLGYYFEFYDIDNDHQDELVYVNHNNLNNPAIVDGGGNPIESGVYWFEIPANPAAVSQWNRFLIDEHFPIDAYDFGNPASQGSPGIFSIGDVDGNGYADIALPGDGTDDLFLLRQKPDHSFVRETIATGTMFGMTKIVDLNNDGKMEVVAAMHNFPEIWQILFPPAGHLKVYIPTLNCTPVTPVLTTDPGTAFCPGITEIEIHASSAQYYVWNDLSTADSILVTNPGTYSVIATDQNGCPANTSIQINAATPLNPIVSNNNGTLEINVSGDSYQWFLNGNPIPGATNATFVPSTGGVYSVEVTDNTGCSWLSNDITVNSTPTGIIEQRENWMLYPNPTNDLSTIETPMKNSRLEIFDLSGRLVFTKELNTTKETISLQALPAGTYWLKITGDRILRPKMLMKQ